MLCPWPSVLLLLLPRANSCHLPFLTDCSQYCAEVTVHFIGMMAGGPLGLFPVSLPTLALYPDALSVWGS